VNGGKGQFCSSSASDLKAQLAKLKAGSLVIMHSFVGVVADLDTTAVGGTKFPGSGITPYGYSAVGVAGASAGSVYESYRRTPLNGNGALLIPLDGSLMLDIRQNYDFVPAAFHSVKVTPNDPKYPGFSTIDYNGSFHKAAVSSGSGGGFWIVTIDRHTGEFKDFYVVETNTHDSAKNKQAFYDLAYLLDVYYNSPDNLLIITTIGRPVSSVWDVPVDLVGAINRLGGSGYLLHTFATGQQTYTLITSPDPDYVEGHRVIESTDAFGNSTQTGELNGFMTRNRKNLWSMNSAVSDSGLSQPLSFAWSKVAFQTPQNYPAWTARQQKAYDDLTAASNHYPAIHTTIGCTTTCGTIRSYYDGGIGGSGIPRVLSINYGDGLAYYPNTDYDDKDFNAVKTQLGMEQSYVYNVYEVYSQFRALTYDQSGTLQSQLYEVADKIDRSLAEGGQDNEMIAKRLTQASQVTTVLSVLPGIGSAFGAITVVLDSAGALVPQYNGVPNDDRYGYTFKELRAGALTAGSDMADSIDSIFLGMVTDWGKMSIVGPGRGSQQTPWYMSPTSDKVPRAALPLIALSAKQQFYLQLMPTVFDIDYATELKTPYPTQIGARWTINGQPQCIEPYAAAPGDTMQGYLHGYPSINYDLFLITNKERGTNIPWAYEQPKYPSQTLLNDVFNQPYLNGDSKLEGGAGLYKAQFLPSAGYLQGREAYRGYGPCSE
jgi:hypothetical protein